MRICIPTTNDAGLAGRLSPHFGRSPYFTLVDVETARTAVLRNRHAQHEEGRCSAPQVVVGGAVNAVVCRGMGAAALDNLRSHGVAVLSTEGWTVAHAVQQFREGTLSPLTPAHAGRHHHG